MRPFIFLLFGLVCCLLATAIYIPARADRLTLSQLYARIRAHQLPPMSVLDKALAALGMLCVLYGAALLLSP